jgi:prephenate dehydrogenase
MWRDICAANKDQVLVELKKFTGKLEEVRRLLEDPPALQKLFADARDARDRWIRSS